MEGRGTIVVVVLFVLVVLAAGFRLVAGADGLSWPDDEAIRELRLVRVGSGLIVGAALGVAGVLLQSLLRNPLASPDLMGLSSGGGFAVMLATFVHHRITGELMVWSSPTAPALLGSPALVGSLAALGVVYLLSQRRGVIDPVSMILVGVIVAMVLTAGTMYLQTLMPDGGMSARRWMMGRLDDDTSGAAAIAVGACTVLVLAMSALSGRSMDVAALSEDEARNAGVQLDLLRTGQFIGAGVLTAGSVVLAGPIGFVGLICPHFVRLLAGPSHRTLLLGSAFAGAALIVGADAAIRLGVLDFGQGRVPIGVIMALFGGPVFLLLLRRQARGVASVRLDQDDAR